jgi:hypothetical protein
VSARTFDSENPSAEPALDSEAVESLIAAYQRTGETKTLGEILERSQPISLSLIRSRNTFRFEDEDELLSAVNRKLLLSVQQFDRTRGTAFSFVNRLCINMLCTRVTLQKKLARRYEALTDTVVNTTPDAANFESQIAVDDLAQQIRSIKSPCTAQSERQAQRWFVESFIDCGFQMRRQECSNAAMKVFSLSHPRSRQLYDLTLLEIRRALWDETKHSELNPAKLRGTKGLPLLRYTNFLSPQEFCKFACLMKDLAPYLVILMKPANESRIRSGNWPAVRENLKLVLEGNPEATPLFQGNGYANTPGADGSGLPQISHFPTSKKLGCEFIER